MAIDTSMYNALKPAQIDSPLENYAKVAQFQQMQNQNRLADLTLQQHQRSLASDNALASLLIPGAKPEDVVSGLAQKGFGNAALAYQKQVRDQQKVDAETAKDKATAQKTSLEAANIALTQHRSMLNNVNDINGAAQWLAAGYQNPDTKPIFERFGPLDEALKRLQANVTDAASFQKWKMGASMNADELVKYTTPDANARLQSDTSLKTTKMNNDTSIRTTGMNNATSLRTTAMTNATTARGQDKPVWDSDRGVFVFPNGPAVQAKGADGQPLGPKDKPLTEDQGKATTFAARMVDANRTLSELEEKGITSKDLATQAAASKWTNWMASSDGQRYRQAQENWVTANLRKESGAVIGKDEMAAEIQKYFPIPGDSPAVIAQKSKARAVAQQGMLTQAGPGAKQVSSISSAGAAPVTSPRAGSVENGYRFKGGNPADPKSWEKV